MEWTVTSFELDDDTFGYLLEDEDKVVAYDTERGRRVPVLHTREGAALFARTQGVDSLVPGGDLDLRSLASFVAGEGPLPDDAVDAWWLLDGVVTVAGRDALSLDEGAVAEGLITQAALSALTDTDETVLRRLLGVRIRCFREAIVQLDAGADRGHGVSDT